MDRTELPPPVAEALAKADVPALRTLAESTDRALKKAAKRALHALRASGVAIPEPERVPVAASAPLSASLSENAREPSRLTAFDGAGERAIFIPLKASTGFTLHVAIVSDDGQLLDLRAHALSRRQLKAYFAALPEQTRVVLREVTSEQAAAALAPALGRATGALGPGARALLGELPEPPKASASDSPPGTPAVFDSARLSESAELFATPLFSATLPEREVILALSHKLEEIAVSPLYLDEAQRLAQLRHAVEQAAAAYFTPDRRGRFAVRANDAAEHFEAHGEPENAERARALAAGLSSERETLSIPFARAFFERILNLEAASKLGPPAAEPPQPAPGSTLITTP